LAYFTFKRGDFMTVRIQVIKVYEIDTPEPCEDAIAYAYGLQTTEIEKVGKLVEALTDHAEIIAGETWPRSSVAI
jgi:hypothetical protein